MSRALDRVVLAAAALLCACRDTAGGGDAGLGETSGGSGGSGASMSSTIGGVDSGTSGSSATVGDDSSGGATSSETGAVGCLLTDDTVTTLDSGMAVHHRAGQSLVQWHDRLEGPDGAQLRYRVYRSPSPIESDDDLAALVPVADGVLNHSGQLFGGAFTPEARLDAAIAMAPVEDLGEPLPPWSGLWAVDADEDACAWYAVVATDLSGVPIESIAPGVNATVDPIAERVEPRAPIKVYDSSDRGIYSPNTEITGTTNLPLHVTLHGSQAQGGGAGDYGDYWLYFGNDAMGWRAGLPGVFSVEETHSGPQTLLMRNRDAIERPGGESALETMWFGYVAEPDGVRHAYPFTEARLEWMIPWVVAQYEVDPEHVTIGGGSMGAWGSVTFGLHRPELFAAVFPDRPRFRQTSLTSITSAALDEDTLPDGTPWRQHHDAVSFVAEHPDDLPFLGWNCGRQDGFATWSEQLDMVAAMTAAHHGFAFAWNDGDHSGGSAAATQIAQWYPPARFARHLGYPAFGNSSIDDDPGGGDPADGDLEGGINLGFGWTDPIDTQDGWSTTIDNALAAAVMTVDVTPRRAQQFLPAAGEMIAWSSSRGPSGVVQADANGLVTVVGVEIGPGEGTTLTLTRM